MATKKTTPAPAAGGATAVALCDIPGLGVRAGQILEASSPAVLEPLLVDGSADAAPAAVDYAREIGASTVQLI